MMRNDAEKILIPCFRDTDIDDLPNEFQILQAQDMSKIGFEQDLLRGIEKVLKKEIVEQVKADGTAIQSLERLVRNADTYMKLRKYEEAYQVFSDITHYYPEDYRGWWGLIRSKTRDLQYQEIPSEEDRQQLTEWFRYVKELAQGDVYREKENEYIAFLEKSAESYADFEIAKINDMVIEYQKQVSRLDERLEKIQREERDKTKTFSNKKDKIATEFEETEKLWWRLKSEVESIKKYKTYGCCILLGGGLISLLLSGIGMNNDMGYVGAAMFWGCIIVGCIVIYKGKMIGDVTTKEKQIKHAKDLLDSLEKEKEDAKKTYEREISAVRVKCNPINEELSVLRKKIDECRNYLQYDKQEIRMLLFSIECGKLGKQTGCSQELFRLRDRIMGNLYEVETLDDRLLKVQCYVCKCISEVTVTEIKKSNNSIKCKNCGQILHVEFKDNGV